MNEFKKPPIDYDEGLPSEETNSDGLDQYEKIEVTKRLAGTNNKENLSRDQIDDKHFARREKTSENQVEEEPEQYLVRSFAELMIRAEEKSHGYRVRIWDMGITEGTNTKIAPPKKYQEAVTMTGSYIDGVIFRVRMPFEFEFDCYGPDLNNPEKRVAFWGGKITENNFDEWEDKIDLGKDWSGHSREWYEKIFAQKKAEDELRQMRRRR